MERKMALNPVEKFINIIETWFFMCLMSLQSNLFMINIIIIMSIILITLMIKESLKFMKYEYENIKKFSYNEIIKVVNNTSTNIKLVM